MGPSRELNSPTLHSVLRLQDDADRALRSLDGMAPAIRATDQALRTRGIAGLLDRPEARGIGALRRRAEDASRVVARPWDGSPALGRLRTQVEDLEVAALAVEVLEHSGPPPSCIGLPSLGDEPEARLEEIGRERREQAAAEAQFRRDVVDLLEASDRRAAEAEVMAGQNERLARAAIVITAISVISGLASQTFSAWSLAVTSICVLGTLAVAWSVGAIPAKSPTWRRKRD